MDSRDSSTAVFAFMKSSSAQGSPLSGRGEDFSSTSEEVESLGLARERSNLNVSITQVFRRSENVFVCFENPKKCQALSKPRSAIFRSAIVEVIKLACSVKGQLLPGNLRAYSTRGMAISWAVLSSWKMFVRQTTGLLLILLIDFINWT